MEKKWTHWRGGAKLWGHHLENVDVGKVLGLVAQLPEHGGEVLRVQLDHEHEDFVPAGGDTCQPSSLDVPFSWKRQSGRVRAVVQAERFGSDKQKSHFLYK
jgi:hypothetical protein